MGEAPHRWGVLPAIVGLELIEGVGHAIEVGVSPGGVGEAPHRWSVLPAVVGLELTEGVGHAVEVGVSSLAVLRRWQYPPHLVVSPAADAVPVVTPSAGGLAAATESSILAAATGVTGST